MSGELTVAPAVRKWRIALVVTGIVLLAIGGITLVVDVPFGRVIGVVPWLVGALVIHDVVSAGLVLAVSIAFRKTLFRLPIAVVLLIQGALVVGGLMSLIVIPAIVKKAVGTANPSVLPLDYATHLALFYAGLFVATVIARCRITTPNSVRSRSSTRACP